MPKLRMPVEPPGPYDSELLDELITEAARLTLYAVRMKNEGPRISILESGLTHAELLAEGMGRLLRVCDRLERRNLVPLDSLIKGYQMKEGMLKRDMLQTWMPDIQTPTGVFDPAVAAEDVG